MLRITRWSHQGRRPLLRTSIAGGPGRAEAVQSWARRCNTRNSEGRRWRVNAWVEHRRPRRNHASMFLAAFLPWPTATVTVRSDGTMSPPANTPGRPVIIWELIFTTPSTISRPATFRRKLRSTSWPSASTSESASMISNSPVGWGKPDSGPVRDPPHGGLAGAVGRNASGSGAKDRSTPASVYRLR